MNTNTKTNMNTKTNTNMNECSICLDDMIDPKTVTTVKCCKQAFHSKCLLEWLLTNRGSTCPLCNANMISPPIVDRPLSHSNARHSSGTIIYVVHRDGQRNSQPSGCLSYLLGI